MNTDETRSGATLGTPAVQFPVDETLTFGNVRDAAGDQAAAANDTPIDFLGPTRYIDCRHADIVAAAAQLTANAADEREKAVRIHDFVRDQVLFGWTHEFYDLRASEVLRARVGFCTTKSTLFIALLRAAGIPARQRFANLKARILDGLVDPRTPYIDHSYTEVELEGRWLGVDSYAVDIGLATAARARLYGEGRTIGYGVHANGVSNWDGASDAFCQYVDDGSQTQLTTIDHGVFTDVGDFYASGRGINRLGRAERFVFRLAAWSANRRIATLRGGKPGLKKAYGM
jgi:Transglutaminase-like superfamily